MGEGVLGVLILHRRSEKILLLCLGLFFSIVVLCWSLYRVLLACLLFHSVGWGLAFLRGLFFLISLDL